MEDTPTAELEEPRRSWSRQRVAALIVAVAFVAAVAGIAVAAGSGGGGAALPKLPAVASQPATGASAAMAMPYRQVEYQVAGNLPALSGKAPAYRLGSSFDAAAAARLVAALGLHGTLAPSQNGWRLTEGGRTLTVVNLPGAPWSFGSDAVAYGTATAVPSCAPPPCPPNAMCEGLCVPPTTVPQPTADLPSQAQAEQQARSIALAGGLPAAPDVTAQSGAGSAWFVDVAPRVGGLPTQAWSWHFDIGAKGAIVYASGFLAQPAKVGDYPLAGTTVGLQRLKDRVGIGPQPMMGVVAQGGPAQTVTIAGVHVALAWRSGYLTPAYVFTDAQGQQVGAVPAATDAYLQTTPTSNTVVPGPSGVQTGSPGAPAPTRPATPPHPSTTVASYGYPAGGPLSKPCPPAAPTGGNGGLTPTHCTG